MSSPEPVLSQIQAGNLGISLDTRTPVTAAHAAPCLAICPMAANEDLPSVATAPPPPTEAELSARVPLSAWLSLAFWAIGTALLFSLGVAYRLLA
ncbi:hypothetical protein [Achromobacter sp.]|uniref:hypothetical protein n=1 Tax=Achromobacter sp. TaxID=134375 RepID=UPI0028A9BF2D|nr:hypothetical protein [Achromobacter sp.]